MKKDDFKIITKRRIKSCGSLILFDGQCKHINCKDCPFFKENLTNKNRGCWNYRIYGSKGFERDWRLVKNSKELIKMVYELVYPSDEKLDWEVMLQRLNKAKEETIVELIIQKKVKRVFSYKIAQNLVDMGYEILEVSKGDRGDRCYLFHATPRMLEEFESLKKERK